MPKLFCDSVYTTGLRFTESSSIHSIANPLASAVASAAGCAAQLHLLQWLT